MATTLSVSKLIGAAALGTSDLAVTKLLGAVVLINTADLAISSSCPATDLPIDEAYSTQFTATGGTAAYVWTASGLPTGLTIASATGIVSGTPTVAGCYDYIIRVTDALGLTDHLSCSFIVREESCRYVTFGALKTQLANRLGDASKIFWTDTELGILLTEALRTFGLCSAFWRERGTFSSTNGTVFYDLPTLLTSAAAELILAYTVTDRDIIQQVQYALLENATSQTSWLGTEQFTYDDVKNSIWRRRNQFQADTGIVVTRDTVAVSSPTLGRKTLDTCIIDIRRLAWLGTAPINYYVTLWREDERLLTAADQTWSVTAATPSEYSVMAPPPLQVQLAPIPAATGTLELLTVNSMLVIDPACYSTVLGIPDDLTPAIKWGALADLLGQDGLARDMARSAYCEKRYGEYVQLARMLPVVVHTVLNGSPLIPCTLQEMDSCAPNWQNQAQDPSNPTTDVILASSNLIALSSIPSSSSTVAMDVVRKTPIPANDGADVQVGLEQLDMILDYAEHLALFKVGGAEWHATERQAQNFLIQSITYNQRLSAAARAALSASIQSQRQKQGVPRRLDMSADALGALKNG